ncbi:hypothetical protein [Niveibacterium sp. COAC-50]|uniref:hypothetical protein n=1 Tax=Niveibacterium sp. COAC-50 TaxID=2729384 RepID=UPI001556450E|nr:hypothetical protein [Niveibacterium sp. COAC-50]
MKKRIATAVALALAGPACAADGQFDWLSFSGFGTLGASMTDDKAVGFRLPTQKNVEADEWATDIDSKLGVQLDFNRGGTISGVLQVIGAQRNEGKYEAEVEWANVMWTINENWRVRAGRMVTPVFLQSDSQNVGYSMIPARYTQEMLGNYPLSRHDGAEVIYGREVGAGRLQVQAFGGVTKYSTAAFDFKADAIYGAAATYSIGPWTFRASGTGVNLKVTGQGADNLTAVANGLAAVPSALCANCAEESQKFKDIVEGSGGSFFGLAATYDEGDWFAQAEYGIRNGSAVIPDTSGLMLLGAYRWKTLTPYIGYSYYTTSAPEGQQLTVASASPVSVKGLAAAVNGIYDSFATDRSVITIGTRWDFYRNVALKLQAEFVQHEYENKAMGGSWPRVAGTTYDGKVNLYTATLDFVF